MNDAGIREIMNSIRGIPNHPPCDCCGKKNGGIMTGGIGDYYVCSDKCYERIKMRINNGLISHRKNDVRRVDDLRIRIKQLEHQLKSVKRQVIK